MNKTNERILPFSLVWSKNNLFRALVLHVKNRNLYRFCHTVVNNNLQILIRKIIMYKIAITENKAGHCNIYLVIGKKLTHLMKNLNSLFDHKVKRCALGIHFVCYSKWITICYKL